MYGGFALLPHSLLIVSLALQTEILTNMANRADPD